MADSDSGANATAHTPITGGQLTVRSLEALGARCVIGLPGQHALALFDALGESRLRYLGGRTEQAAATMADGAARIQGAPVPLLLSAGPGALGALPAIQEARDASSPVLVIAAGVPRIGQGGARKGLLHELDDQASHYEGLVKGSWRVRSASQIPSALAAAWRRADAAPQGPVYVELPSDVLSESVPDPLELPKYTKVPFAAVEQDALLRTAAQLLASAEAPALFVGGGAVRGHAELAVRELAEALGAPVVTTPGGRRALSFTHPLSVGGWIEDVAVTQLLDDADVLLAVGTGLGELNTNYRTLSPRGQLIHLDADERRIGSNYPTALGLVGDAATLLPRLLDLTRAELGAEAGSTARTESGRERAAAVRRQVADRILAQGLQFETSLLQAIRNGVPESVPTFWDMTVMAYWAWSGWDAQGGVYENAQSGELGFGYAAGLGAAFAHEGRVVVVSGDGGAAYGLAELATAAQRSLSVTWLVISDDGYGILREYMQDAFGRTTATDLDAPDLVAIAQASGVPAREVVLDELAEALARSVTIEGPELLLLKASPRMFAPTHQGRPERGGLYLSDGTEAS